MVEQSKLKILKGLAKPNRYFYSLLRDKIALKPVKTESRWKREIPDLVDWDWEDIYCMSKKVTKDTKLQVFQFQLIHNYLVTNSKLVYYKIKESNLCTFCNNEKETVVHLLWECEKTQHIYKEYCEWLGQTCGLQISLRKSNVLLGIFPVVDNILENLILLYMKRYMYINRCKNNNIIECRRV